MVYERSPDSWVARVTIDGRQIWLGTHRTKEEAEAAVIRAGKGDLPSTITVEHWAAKWQLIYPGNRNPETNRQTQIMVAPFARAYARRRLTDITPLMAQSWAVTHPGQVRYLRLMFGKAVRAGILDRNVWEGVELPTGGADSPPAARRSPAAWEVDALVSAARRRYGDRTADMLVFTAYTGLRLMEVADVQAGDVRSDGRRLLVRGKRRAGEADPRERTVAVFPAAREAFLRHAPDVGLVWRSPAGRRWSRAAVARVMRSATEDAGIERLTFHGLRHWHATWLLNQGASDLDVALQLGHGRKDGTVDPTLVRRTYGHPDVESGLQRLEALR